MLKAFLPLMLSEFFLNSFSLRITRTYERSFARPYQKYLNKINVIERTDLFAPLIPIRNIVFDNKNVTNKTNTNKTNKDKTCILFFTGLNSFISHKYYSSLLNKIVELDENFIVYTPQFYYKNIDMLIDLLQKEYKEVILVGHSSGADSILNVCEKAESIKKIVLMDPVHTKVLQINKFSTFPLKHVSNTLFMYANKSYNEKSRFIPDLFSLNKTSFSFNKDCKIEVVTKEEFGHCDLLNPFYSNIVYFLNLIDGTTNRNIFHLYNYHKWIAQEIHLFSNKTHTTSLT